MKKYCTAFSYARIILIVLSIFASSEAFGEQWGPLITTDWDQGDMAAMSHYNKYCPTDPFEALPSPPFPPDEPWRCPVGCVATALGQIVNYWQYPSSISFGQSDEYYYHVWRLRLGDVHEKVTVDADHQERDFPTFATLDSHLSYIAYNGDPTEEAYLCFGLGIKLEMAYECDGSGSYTRGAGSALIHDLSYGSAIVEYDEDGVWTTEQKQRVIENIKAGWPVQMGIRCEAGGHSVVVDGYNDSTGEFHINFGWAGEGTDTWYSLPEFNAGGHHWDLVHTLVYDVCPFQGWNQWGADEKNTFSTIYVAPTTYPPREKWHNTCPSTHYFKGLVVGTGNKIYASCSPRFQKESYIGSVWVVNQYGIKENEITLTGENEGITYPVQDKNGKVFVATGSGNVWKINTRTDTATKIFTESSGAQLFHPPKVDSGNYLYVCTDDNLYCMTSTGHVNWSFSAPSGSQFFREIPAIDVYRNHVYIGYYNSSTDTSYVGCINRLTGTLIHQKTINNISPTSYSTGTPSVGPDGTVYVGCYTKLYALNPDLSQKWVKDFYPGLINDPPTIGKNNTLYLSYWKTFTEQKVAAIDASNKGQIKWEIPSGGTSDYDNVGDIYFCGNGVVCYTLSRENGSAQDTYTVFAYRDNGDNCTYLWEKEFGTSGGQTAFGPGATLYVIPSSGYGHTITAISEGDVGDPDGGGMGFTDNAAPLIPSNATPADGAEDVDYEVTLSWDCTDPESHDLSYSLFVGESGYDMVPVVTNVVEKSYILLGLKAGTGYAWKIIATDGQAVTEGPTWVFSTKTQTLVGDFCGEGSEQPDGYVDYWDLLYFAQRWHSNPSDTNWDSRCDLDKEDNYVDYWDLLVFAQQWHKGDPP